MRITIWPAPGYGVSVVNGEFQGSDAHLARGSLEALDIATPMDTELLCCATNEARITYTGLAGTAGESVWFEWVDGARYRCRYAHLSTGCPFPRGALVSPGEVIGWSGNSGQSTGPHLHWALERLDGTTWTRLRLEDYLTEAGMTPEELARLEAVEQELQRLHQFGLGTFGNITMEDGGREPSNPVKLLLGKLGEALGLYAFFQRRFGGEADGEYWAGIETSQQPPDGKPVAWGYGSLPMRLWGQNMLLEANGALVVRNVVAERVYLSPPVYRDMRTGAFVSPSGWSAAGEPLDGDGNLLGGIYYDSANLGTYLTLHDGRPVVVADGQVRPL